MYNLFDNVYTLCCVVDGCDYNNVVVSSA